jgi:hypothetical protein
MSSRRNAPAAADLISTDMLLVPVIGVTSAALILGEPWARAKPLTWC